MTEVWFNTPIGSDLMHHQITHFNNSRIGIAPKKRGEEELTLVGRDPVYNNFVVIY